MTTSTIAPAGRRPEAGVAAVSAAAVTATPGAGEGGPSHRQRRPWWRRLWIPSFPGQSADEYQRTSLEQLLALLEAAREELAAGWVKDGWWSVPSGGGLQALATGLAAGVSRSGPVGAVCLVGALVRAGSRQRPGGQDPGGQDPGRRPRGRDEQSSGISRAIDAVYDALWESRGQPAAHAGPGLPPLPSPQVRLAQVQALTRWNDAEARTGDEVLAVLDRAISHTMLSLAAMPAPAGGPAPADGPAPQRDREPAGGTACS